MTAAAEATPLYVLRQAEADDVPFICNSWVRSYYNDFAWLHRDQVEQDAYFDGQRALVGHILERCGALIACNPEKPTQIFGYLVAEKPDAQQVAIVHWLYVKQHFRRMGIAKQLLQTLGAPKAIYCSHWTPLCAGKRDQWGLVFHPFTAVRFA